MCHGRCGANPRLQPACSQAPQASARTREPCHTPPRLARSLATCTRPAEAASGRRNRELDHVPGMDGDRLGARVAPAPDRVQLELQLVRVPYDVRTQHEQPGGESRDHAQPDALPGAHDEHVHVQKVLVEDLERGLRAGRGVVARLRPVAAGGDQGEPERHEPPVDRVHRYRSSTGCPTIPSGSPCEIAGVATTYSTTPANGAGISDSVFPKKSVTTPITMPAGTAWPRSTRGYQIPVPGLRSTSARSNQSGCGTCSTSPASIRR